LNLGARREQIIGAILQRLFHAGGGTECNALVHARDIPMVNNTADK